MNLPESFENENVVVDTDSQYTYIGRLSARREGIICLDEAAIYNAAEGKVTLDQYLDECAAHGHAVSRQRVWVQTTRIISSSLLCDIVKPGRASD